jgi:hypothetical protein
MVNAQAQKQVVTPHVIDAPSYKKNISIKHFGKCYDVTMSFNSQKKLRSAGVTLYGQEEWLSPSEQSGILSIIPKEWFCL